jgi:hypothetical protein
MIEMSCQKNRNTKNSVPTPKMAVRTCSQDIAKEGRDVGSSVANTMAGFSKITVELTFSNELERKFHISPNAGITKRG